jgi:hypothetical protein
VYLFLQKEKKARRHSMRSFSIEVIHAQWPEKNQNLLFFFFYWPVTGKLGEP